jgi:hypothetical protein
MAPLGSFLYCNGGIVKKVKYWYKFAPKVWCALVVGWSMVLFAFTPFLTYGQAGALLICGAIVSEVFHNKRHRKFIEQISPESNIKHIYVEVSSPDQETKHIEVTPQPRVAGKVSVNTES